MTSLVFSGFPATWAGGRRSVKGDPGVPVAPHTLPGEAGFFV